MSKLSVEARWKDLVEKLNVETGWKDWLEKPGERLVGETRC